MKSNTALWNTKNNGVAGVAGTIGPLFDSVDQGFFRLLKKASSMTRKIIDFEEEQLGIGEAIARKVKTAGEFISAISDVTFQKIDHDEAIREKSLARHMADLPEPELVAFIENTRNAWNSEIKRQDQLATNGDEAAPHIKASMARSLNLLEMMTINEFFKKDSFNLFDLSRPVPGIALEFLFLRESIMQDGERHLLASQHSGNIDIKLSESGHDIVVQISDLEDGKMVSSNAFVFEDFNGISRKLQEDRLPIAFAQTTGGPSR